MIEGEIKWGGGYIKADLQGLFQHQSATSFFLSHYSSDTNMHTYTHGLSRRVTNTHFDVFFPRCINKKKSMDVGSLFLVKRTFPHLSPQHYEDMWEDWVAVFRGKSAGECSKIQRNDTKCGFFPPGAHHYSNAQAEGKYTIRVQHSRNIHLNDCASWSVTKFVDFIGKLTFKGNVFLIHCTAEALLWPIKRF